MSAGGSSHEPSLEQQVASLKQQLAHAQRLAVLGELLSTTTHEFNNVLTTVINYAQMGLRHHDPATQQKAFDRILTAGQRAAKITANILGLARNRSGEREPTDLARLIDDVLVLLEREMTKYRIAVEKNFDEVPLAMVCGNQIQQILVNLMVNARQAMSGGGRLILKLSHDPDQELIDLVVRDTGTGIPADQLRRIFDPYYSTKAGPDESGKGGTGLGLAHCREIIEAHQGRIRVESTPGRGTSFTLRLPTVHRAAATGGANPRSDAPSAAQVRALPTSRPSGIALPGPSTLRLPPTVHPGN